MRADGGRGPSCPVRPSSSPGVSCGPPTAEAADDALEAYEREACRYSLQALHEAGVTHLDQWLADHSACDQAYLRHFYQSGERLPFSGFWREGTPPLEPLAIPPFTPRRWRRRGRAIVL